MYSQEDLSPLAHERTTMIRKRGAKRWHCPKCTYTRSVRKECGKIVQPYCYGLMTTQYVGSFSLTANDLLDLGIDATKF